MISVDYHKASGKTKNRDFNKPRLPYEVESWAFGFDEQFEYQRSYFDEVTDDSYLDRILPNEENKINPIREGQRRMEIREILQNIRKMKNNPSRSKRPQIIQVQESPKIVEHLKKEEEKQEKKSKKTDKQKYESISNGLSRAVPGVLQQNITIERTYFKDLIMLSKQRYTVKKNLVYQKKIFEQRQEKKGFLSKVNEKINDTKDDEIFDKINQKTSLDETIKVINKANKKFIRPASATGFCSSIGSEESFLEDSKVESSQINRRPKTSLPFFPTFESNSVLRKPNDDDEYDMRQTKKSSSSSLKKPLEDKRFRTLMSSMNNFYKTDIKTNEKQLKPSSLRKIINTHEALKDFKYEKIEGTGRHEIEVKTKVFERLVAENNFKF